jgi:molecular chaperone HscA
VEASVQVKPSYGLGDEDITRMLKDAFTHAKDDMYARALSEQIVDAQGLIAATRAAMAEDGALLNETETAVIETSIIALEKLMVGPDHQAIKRGIEALNAVTTEFAQRRMDQNVRRAMAGQKLETFG